MKFTLYRSDVIGNKANCVYPIKEEIMSAESLAQAAAYDHVCASYRDSRRGNRNFDCSDVIVMDLDNDHTDNPKAWITAERLDGILPDVSYALVPSRHHMEEKDGHAARPKWHVYFPVDLIADADEYAAMKREIQRRIPFFDPNALDAARFVFGSGKDGVIWHEGWMDIDDFLDETGGPEEDAGEEQHEARRGPITEGSRNNTLSRFAGRVIKRYGNSGRAHEIFMQEAGRCEPPLPDSELATIWASAVRFYETQVKTQEGYMEPGKYNDDFGRQTLRPDDFSDIGQARALAKEYENELLFTNATDYLRFDGDRWVEDRQLAVGAAEEFTDLQLADAMDELKRAKDALIGAGVSRDAISAGGKTLEKAISGEEQGKLLAAYLSARQYVAFAMKRRDYKYLSSALNAAKPMVLADVNDLDGDGFLLNTPYATYDLRAGLSGDRPHDPRDRITKITAVSPGDDGEKEWLDALELFFCNDAELIHYVKLVVGLAAIGRVYVEQILVAYGSGSNGKSTFWNTLARVMGSYSGKLSAETLTVGCKHNAKPEMAELKGKRLVIASETEEGMRLNTAMIKQLSSTDDIFAEKKYKNPFSFTPSHTLVLYTNHLPRVGANDDGTWRRLVVIPFNAHITGSADVKNYSDVLFEHSGPAIMAWIIDGAQEAIERNFRIPRPKCVCDAIEAYRENNDWLGNFLEECCDVSDGRTEKSGELYRQYRAFCAQTGDYIRSTTDFYAAIDLAGFTRRKTKQGSIVHGLSLKSGMDFLE